MVTIKTTFENDIRRVTAEHPLTTFLQLKELIKSLYGKILPEHFAMKYKDDEGDLVTVSSNVELLEALSMCKESGVLKLQISRVEQQKRFTQSCQAAIPDKKSVVEMVEDTLYNSPLVRRLFEKLDLQPDVAIGGTNEQKDTAPYVESPNREPEERKVTHLVACRSCSKNIIGVRFKCTDCPDFNLCEKCKVKPKRDLIHDKSHTFSRSTRSTLPARRRRIGFSPPISRRDDEPPLDVPSLQVEDLTSLSPREEEVLIPLAPLPSPLTSTTTEALNVLADPCALPLEETPQPTEEQDKPVVENTPMVEEEQETRTGSMPWGQEQTQIYPLPRPFGLPEVILSPDSPARSPLERRANTLDPKTLFQISNLESKLHQLKEMGFGNDEQNTELLSKHNGDLLLTVKDLIELC